MMCMVCKKLGLSTDLTAPDLCPICGSLEGLCESRDLPPAAGSVGHDWAGGSVAPWRTRDGSETYATPPALARAALAAAGLRPLVVNASAARAAVVIDLGCGDAQILREAAAHFGARGIGFDIDELVLAEARARVQADGLEDLISLSVVDIMKAPLASKVVAARQQFDVGSHCVVVVTCFLLPAALKRLGPRLGDLVVNHGAILVTFTWDMEGIWEGPPPDVKGPDNRFTVYRALLPSAPSSPISATGSGAVD